MPERESPKASLQEPPRIGVPYRQSSEERRGDRQKIQPYLDAVSEAGGNPILVSLFLSAAERAEFCRELDGFLLPGSPADVDPARYSETRASETADPDPFREETDMTLLNDAFLSGKPVLGVCYGAQLLNVYRGGTLIQDIASEWPSALTHSWAKSRGEPEPHHPAQLVPGSEVARLAEASEAVVGSSHHQSIRQSGHGLRIAALAPDGIVEAVECGPGEPWVVGVQWHPERDRNPAEAGGARLARALFRRLVSAARQSRQENQQRAPSDPAPAPAGARNQAEER